MLTKLKQKAQAMLAAEAQVAHKMGLTPNRVSAIGIVLAFLSAFAYTQWATDKLYFLLATTLLLLSGFCDVLDGVIARLYQQATPFGGFLDSLLDRYADAAIYVGIVLGSLCNTLWGMLALVGSLLVSYSRARAEVAGTRMETVGIAERAERIIILATASVIAFFWEPAFSVMNGAMILLAILTNLTVIQRCAYANAQMKKRENTGEKSRIFSDASDALSQL